MVISKPTQLSNNAGSEVAAGFSQSDQVLEDSRLGREQSLLEEGGGPLWLMSFSSWTRRGNGLKGPAQCHVHAEFSDLTVTIAFSGFA